MNYKEIKSYEDACKALNVQPISENAVAAFPEADRKSILAFHKLTVIARALNEGWKPDWNDNDKNKYYPLFNYSKDGLSYFDASNATTKMFVYVGSQLCFRDHETARYAGRTFTDLYKDFYCIPASAEERAGKDFMETAKRIAETQIVPLVENSKTRGIVFVACDVDAIDKDGDSATGVIIGACGSSKEVITGLAELRTRPETSPLVEKAAELAAIRKIREKIEREGASIMDELLNKLTKQQ